MLVKLQKYIPNCFTFFNLSLGFFAILAASHNDFQLGCLLVLLAGILDRMDGKMARKFDAVSDLGKELDSLSDLVSFGVAPALLVYAYALQDFHVLGPLAAVVFVVAGAFRLARFNVTDQASVFMGVPITVAGCLLALALLFHSYYRLSPYVIMVLTLFLSYSMISKYRIKKM